MANETFKQGKNLFVYIYDTDNSAYEPIGCSDSDSLSESRDVEEFETKCGPGINSGAYSAELSGEGRFVDELVDTGRQSHRKLSKYLRNDTQITWRRETGVGNAFEYGQGKVTSVEMVTETTSVATYSYTISVIGLPTDTDPNA
jgi:hypothetical protein